MGLVGLAWCTEVLLVELAIFGDWAAYNTLILGTSLYSLLCTEHGSSFDDDDHEMPLEWSMLLGDGLDFEGD